MAWNIIVFVVYLDTFAAPKYGLIGGICPAGLSSVIGMNESLVGYAIARFIGAYTTHNNGIGWHKYVVHFIQQTVH